MLSLRLTNTRPVVPSFVSPHQIYFPNDKISDIWEKYEKYYIGFSCSLQSPVKTERLFDRGKHP